MSYSISGINVDFQVTPRDAETVIKCLKAGLAIHDDPPCWVDGRKADGLIVFKNGIVDIGSGNLRRRCHLINAIGGYNSHRQSAT